MPEEQFTEGQDPSEESRASDSQALEANAAEADTSSEESTPDAVEPDQSTSADEQTASEEPTSAISDADQSVPADEQNTPDESTSDASDTDQSTPADEQTTSEEPTLDAAQADTSSEQPSLDPDRPGTFIIPDIYPLDLGSNPPFEILPGMVVNGMEVTGCVVKASEGVGWGAESEEWFKRSWTKIREVAADRYGVDFFRGCYHFLRFSADGAKQADYFCDLVDAAGGWGEGDLMPWVDVEEGGQGSWAPQRLETIEDPVLRQRLADQVTTCTTAFIARFKERTGLRIAVYGRGVFRDLQMTDCKFGSDSAVNPAYTATMPPMDKYGVPLDDISLWQLGGDDGPVNPRFPKELPGWGTHDYSVYINGSRPTTLIDARDHLLARSP